MTDEQDGTSNETIFSETPSIWQDEQFLRSKGIALLEELGVDIPKTQATPEQEEIVEEVNIADVDGAMNAKGVEDGPRPLLGLEEVLRQLAEFEENLNRNQLLHTDSLEAIKEIQNRLKNEKGFFDKHGSNIMGLTGGIIGAISNLSSGDPNKIVVGSMAIVGAIGDFLPTPANILTKMGSSIVSGVFAMQDAKETESTEEMFKRVMDDALKRYKIDELATFYEHNRKDVANRIRELHRWNAWTTEKLLRENRTGAISNALNGRLADIGEEFMNKIQRYINEETTAGKGWYETDKPQNIAFYVYAYANVAYLRMQAKNLKAVLYSRLDYPGLSEKAMKERQDAVDEAKVALLRLSQPPNAMKRDIHDVYAALHKKLPFAEIELVQSFMATVLKTPMPGTLVRIKNTRHGYMMADEDHGQNMVEANGDRGPGHDNSSRTLFRVIGNSHDFMIFSMHTAKYLRMYEAMLPKFFIGIQAPRRDWYRYGRMLLWDSAVNKYTPTYPKYDLRMPLRQHHGDWEYKELARERIWFVPDAYKFELKYSSLGAHIFNKRYQWNIYATGWGTDDWWTGNHRYRPQVLAYTTKELVTQGVWVFEQPQHGYDFNPFG